MRTQLIEQSQLPGSTDGSTPSPFDFNRVTSEVNGFKETLALEADERDRLMGKFYREDDLDLLDEAHVKNHSEAFRVDKEAEEEFEDIWQGLTQDIYQNLREDLRSQYDQARTLMKLNQQLRQRLIHQTRSTRQLLQHTLRQREKLIGRLEIASKDVQSDVIPLRAFDFIAHERKISANKQASQQRKNLAKQYLERKFNH